MNAAEKNANQRNSMEKERTPGIDAQRKFWDWHWQNWQERKTLNEWTARRAEVMLDIIRSLRLEQPKFLDLGCGRGWFTARLAELGEATGVDLSPDAIAAARSEYPGIAFLSGNLYEAPLPVEHFDFVVSQEVIAHVEDQNRYVARAANALRPGGYFIVSTGNKFVMDRLGDVGWNVHPPDHIERELGMKGLKKLLRPRFNVLRSRTIIPLGHAGVLRMVNSVKLNAALGLLIPPRQLEALKEKAGLGYQMIVLAQRRA